MADDFRKKKKWNAVEPVEGAKLSKSPRDIWKFWIIFLNLNWLFIDLFIYLLSRDFESSGSFYARKANFSVINFQKIYRILIISFKSVWKSLINNQWIQKENERGWLCSKNKMERSYCCYCVTADMTQKYFYHILQLLEPESNLSLFGDWSDRVSAGFMSKWTCNISNSHCLKSEAWSVLV